MNVRKPLAQKTINSNIDETMNFSFQKSTEKKPSRTESLQTDESKKRCSKDKEMIDMFLGELKEHNHEKMIQMFGELRKQNKEKEEKNQLLIKQVEQISEEFKQVKLEYGRCLKQKSRLQEDLTSQSRSLNIYQTKAESQERQINQLLKKQEENLYYKSQLFDANEKLNDYKRKFVDSDETVENQKEFKFKEMQWTYEMKLDECQQHIKELEKQNWELSQLRIKNETLTKKLNIELNEANFQLKRLSSTSYFPHLDNSSHKKNHFSTKHQNQEIQELKDQIQSLEKQLSQTIETYELKIVQLQSEVELEKFKTQTYAEHSQSLQEKISLIQNDFNSTKSETLNLQDLYEKQQSKALDYDALLKEVLTKLHELKSQNPILSEYCSILLNKMQRISEGKSVTFLKHDTKDFVSITSRSNSSDTYGLSSLVRFNKGLKTHQKLNSLLHEEEQSSYRDSIRSNFTSVKKTQENDYFSKNSQFSQAESSRPVPKKDKIESKILEERKQIENRIREKYMKSRPKTLDQKSDLKELPIPQELKESSISSEEDASPHFKRENRRSIYLTSEFQQ